MDWFVVLIFIIVVILVWIFLMINAKKDKPDIVTDIHPHRSVQETSVDDNVSTRAADIIELTEDELTPAIKQPTPARIIDDLKIIEGIGPKVNALMNENGITSFEDLAKTEVAQLREILDKAGYQYMDPSTWGEQASLLMHNRVREFEELVKVLKGGRRVS